jgi:hypothetical protein
MWRRRGKPLMGNSVPEVKHRDMAVLVVLLAARIVTSFMANGGLVPLLWIMRSRTLSSIGML